MKITMIGTARLGPAGLRSAGLVGTLAVAGLLAAACGGSAQPGSSSSGSPGTGAGAAAAAAASTSHLIDGSGRTLYLFAADKGSTSSCYGSCAQYWPPVKAGTQLKLSGGGATSGTLGTTPRKDGSKQVTYAGHPLYTYSGDSRPGDTAGQGRNLSGGLWWIVSPSGAAITKAVSSAPATGSGNSQSGGYGGGY
ncbi:MAG: COG4315 family predicted lipoprotein [Sciscionella sp.]